LLEMDKLAEAESQLKKSIELDPDDVFAHVDLGKTLDLQGKPKEAAEELKIVHQLRDKASSQKK
jgi:predicted Zn-dependent protease